MDTNPDWENIKIKADLLCLGIQPNNITKEIFHRQNPCHDQKTGNVGIHISLEGGSHVLVTVSHNFDNISPYSLKSHGEDLVLLKGEKIVNRIKEVPMLEWYSKKTSTMKQMPDIFLHEGKAFLHQTYSGCDYFSNGQECKYCGSGDKWRENRDFLLFSDNGQYKSV